MDKQRNAMFSYLEDRKMGKVILLDYLSSWSSLIKGDVELL
jgi:hypothetical protein